MTLSEEQKKKIEEEEAYRAELRGNPKKKKGIGCLGVLLVILTVFIIGTVGSSIEKSSKSQGNNPVQETNSVTKEVPNESKEEITKTFCDERSKPSVRTVNLNDYILMYEKTGETVSLRPANGVYPTSENCQKVIDICLKMWNEEDCRNIGERKIWIGMTDDQLILSWGLPNDRNDSVYSSGVHSQWVYGDFKPYVYLEGKEKNSMAVTSWQD